MSEKKTSIEVPQQGGMVRSVLNQLKLIFRLMGDSRVNILAKIVPVGALIYLFSPDPIMFPVIGALDDAAILWLGSYVFTELCPPAVVQEHMKALNANLTEGGAQDDVVDAESTEIKDE